MKDLRILFDQKIESNLNPQKRRSCGEEANSVDPILIKLEEVISQNLFLIS